MRHIILLSLLATSLCPAVVQRYSILAKTEQPRAKAIVFYHDKPKNEQLNIDKQATKAIAVFNEARAKRISAQFLIEAPQAAPYALRSSLREMMSSIYQKSSSNYCFLDRLHDSLSLTSSPLCLDTQSLIKELINTSIARAAPAQ